ncbi:proline iminopeptidase [Cognatiyoonia koreensis]|uniref:Proline iminopeptidase n=1 Tax=Cognatiyoonia koreensis TaxID=364200 RepID=A0A1I0MIA6_9RHOB|nr:alpha/beta hydrolase [Cognatiyoonia koreensis]SEV88002.1 proline iminopeptidase [Cognatiyoonia koreensis]
MKRILKWAIVMCGCVLVAIMAAFVATRGDYPVARLVTDDLSLPSETVAGVQLHLKLVNGPAGSPTIIVLHGGPGGDFRSLQALEALSDQYRVVFYDQRGAGLSERVPAEMLTLDGHLDELAAVIDRLSSEEAPTLIGHSWGAMLATAYLGQSLDSVQAAVLIEPGYLDRNGHATWQAESLRYLSGPNYWKEAIVTGLRSQHIGGPDEAARHDFLIGHMVGVFADHPENPYHCGDGYTAPHWRFGGLSSDTWGQSEKTELERLTAKAAGFSGPVLLMAGACNDWTGEQLQQSHLSLFSAAELSIIPDAGHDVIWDNPNAALAVIRRFLNAGTLE